MNRKNLAERLKKKLQPTECWIWNGAKSGSGYGLLKGLTPKVEYAHRLSYELFFGSIPEGFEVDHLCRVKECVNPLHLEPVTPYENNMRSTSTSSLNAKKTHCKRGHELTPDNLSARKDQRQCLKCSALLQKERYWRLKENKLTNQK